VLTTEHSPKSPDDFIPVAEDTGLISDLGARVLDDALTTLVRCRAAHPGQLRVRMSVNLSARQVRRPSLTEEVRAALDKFGLAADDLVLELTASVLLESATATLRQIRDLHEAGVNIAIDDFGTGYASLRYLTTLPVNSVKVDRSFTAGMTTDRTSASIVRAVAALASDLDLGCVVEGIETVEQLLALPFGVQGQGCLLGRGHRPDRRLAACGGHRLAVIPIRRPVRPAGSAGRFGRPGPGRCRSIW